MAFFCTLCPKNCGAAREDVSSLGECGCLLLPRVSLATLHHGEEPPLDTGSGSGAVFFAGCALRCVFCQNAEISQTASAGKATSPEELARVFETLENQGASNINLVSGTPHALSIIEALRIRKPNIPVVWNTSGYETISTVDTLAPFVDIWLPDYKYADPALAEVLSGAHDYPAVALDAIKRMREISGGAGFSPSGAMTRGTIVRHLVLPKFIKNSFGALTALAENLPRDTHVSLMGQFTPYHNSANFGLNQKLSQKAWRLVALHRAALGLDEGWNQPPTASGTAMIPKWSGAA